MATAAATARFYRAVRGIKLRARHEHAGNRTKTTDARPWRFSRLAEHVQIDRYVLPERFQNFPGTTLNRCGSSERQLVRRNRNIDNNRAKSTFAVRARRLPTNNDSEITERQEKRHVLSQRETLSALSTTRMVHHDKSWRTLRENARSADSAARAGSVGRGRPRTAADGHGRARTDARATIYDP